MIISICNDEHDAKHGARSVREQLQARSKTTKPGASSFTITWGRTGPVCERSRMEEHRTGGGADGMERRRTFRSVVNSPNFKDQANCSGKGNTQRVKTVRYHKKKVFRLNDDCVSLNSWKMEK